MTLILTAHTRESIWMLADRRLKYVGRSPKEDARKMMFLDTADGTAILGYAGLGATARGTEPSDWMSAALRGQHFSLENSLGVLADAMKRQFPRHLLCLPRAYSTAHNILVPSFVNGELRLYTIGLEFAPDRRAYRFRYTRLVRNLSADRHQRTPPLGAVGSGEACLRRDKRWRRELLRLIRACDLKRVSPQTVADHLATINWFAHRNTADGTVGPRCIVAWRHNSAGVHKGGGGQQYYTGVEREVESGMLPAIVRGLDMQAVAQAMMSLS
jgi:hypothetical protein